MTCPTITIDMDKRCAECGQAGAAPSGLCLRCAIRTLSDAPMRSLVGKAVQQRFSILLSK